jgi:hypothetical protein
MAFEFTIKEDIFYLFIEKIIVWQGVDGLLPLQQALVLARDLVYHPQCLLFQEKQVDKPSYPLVRNKEMVSSFSLEPHPVPVKSEHLPYHREEENMSEHTLGMPIRFEDNESPLPHLGARLYFVLAYYK